MNPQALTVIFGLASAVFWGAGDFTGGLASKRTSVYGVVIVSQAMGFLVLLTLALLFGEPVPELTIWLVGAGAGAIGAIGLTALYQGLASGRMGIVAPVTSIVAAIVPVIYGFFLEGAPDIQQMAGFGLAIVAVWLISRTGEHVSVGARDLILPVGAGLCFGIFIILIDSISEVSVYWSLVSARIASVSLLLIVCAVLRQRPIPARQHLPIALLAGALDAGGNAFYALASRVGRLDIAATLSALHPGSTVLLARFVLNEKLERQQWIGVFLSLVAVLLIAF